MKLLDVLNSDFIRTLKKEVLQFTTELLSDYLYKLHNFTDNYSAKINPKDIHDAVWGTINLHGGEVLIIDSPLIQRLRKIQNLGLAYLIFPGAEYSRFEHTIGTLHVADRIATKVFNSLGENRSSLPLPPVNIVRLAALFHDVGHTVCSHASERYLIGPLSSRSSEFQKIVRYFIEKTAATRVDFSEIISALIVTSKPVIELLKIATGFIPRNNFVSSRQYEELSVNIAALILGLPINLELLPYSTILNGPIDADKCDYLARDSYRTGVPVAVDLSRVIQKLLPVNILPKNFTKVWDEPASVDDSKYFILGIAMAAVRSIEEILISRTLLHEKIYHHHKIRTAENMLRHAFYLLEQSGISSFLNLSKFLSITDNDIICRAPEAFLEKLFELDLTGNTYFDEACLLIKNIYFRNLSKRALIINNDYITTYAPDNNLTDFFRDIFEYPLKESQCNFLDSVRNEVEIILKDINKSNYEIKDFKNYILVSPYPDVVSSDLNICIDMGRKGTWYRDKYKGELWDNSRKIKTTEHCIIAPRDLLIETFIATEKVLFKDYGILLKEESYELCKLITKDIDELKAILIEKNYFIDAPSLMPIDIYLNRPQLDRIENLVVRWKDYQGPHGFSIKSSKVIESYLKQFFYLKEDYNTLFEGLIKVLERINLVNREIIVSCLCNIIQQIIDHYSYNIRELNFFLIGNLFDGSPHLGYYFNDVSNHFDQTLKLDLLGNLHSVIYDNDYPIIFVEDAFYSGTQIVSIFQTLLNVPLPERETNEEHCYPLSSETIKNLQKRKIFLIFCYKNSFKENIINQKFQNLGLDITILSDRVFPPPLFNIDSCDPFQTFEEQDLVKNAFQSIGTQLLLFNKATNGGFKDRWDMNRIENSCLGYGNAQQCHIFHWNSPTYTLTPLWMEGELDNGQKWVPLFPRVNK